MAIMAMFDDSVILEEKNNSTLKIDTKKPLNHLKLDETTIVLREDLLILSQDNLFKFILKGQNYDCNIISEGKMAKFQQTDPKIELRYIIRYGKNLGQAYKFEEVIKYFNNSNEGDLLKDLSSRDKILIAELLSVQNKINEKELARQEEKSEIRSHYGF